MVHQKSTCVCVCAYTIIYNFVLLDRRWNKGKENKKSEASANEQRTRPSAKEMAARWARWARPGTTAVYSFSSLRALISLMLLLPLLINSGILGNHLETKKYFYFYSFIYLFFKVLRSLQCHRGFECYKISFPFPSM